MPATPSLNFKFLSKINSVIVDLAGFAELYAFTDPNSALVKTRQIGELLVKQIYAKQGRSFDPESRQVDLINDLWKMGLVTDQISQMLHEVRKKGNDAVHEIHGDRNEALYHLRTVHRIAVWLYKSFYDRHFKQPSFSPPPEPVDASEALKEELDRLKAEFAKNEVLRQELAENVVNEAELRLKAEADAKKAYEELETAIQLGEEDNARLSAKIKEYEARLVAESKSAYVTTAQVEAAVETAAAVEKEVITEDDTREIIDRQLKAAGWIVDTKKIRHSAGKRPQKGKNIAIAEWPTTSGPADYVLFVGLMPIAVVEAKKQTIDVAGAIGQAKRYSRDYVLKSEEISPGGPWGEYKIPFLFSTNGRSYLKQLKTKSGIWFHDTRVKSNHPRALVSWYSPLGLKQLLTQDQAAAEAQLESESSDYLPLRYYQRDAVAAVEDAIKDGQREILVAMATGTGKTRTCIGICYRLIKAKRFRRILFLVDRTSLGEQTADSFKDLRLENNQTFTDIYDVKELGDVEPDADTKFQIATIQSMVHRLLNNDEADNGLSVDQYDCIVVDECHRGYNLDQELSDSELRFRDEADYISKYSRVIEYFDAVKIGLTATPAIHTIEIFGGETRLPIYQYSYRQAVLDGYLVDHEPPLGIRTELGEGGIKWEVNEQVTTYNTRTQQIELFNTPDEIELEIDSFNKRVINENFNRVICQELAKHIDPDLPGKTLVFCVTDSHADMVVDELKKAFTKQYGSVQDDAIRKITGKSDKPLQLIRRYKNEALPSIAVTVDLLTTGIDVPAIANLVFLRRVRSRILYDQMIGRGTRLCPDLYGERDDKDCFRIFDCVDLYSALQKHSDMKPVVTRPNITFSQLVDELAKTTNAEDLQTIKDQLIAKLQRKKRSLKGDNAKTFEDKSGTKPEPLVKQLQKASPAEISEWFADKTNLVEFLDTVTTGAVKIMISDHDDAVTKVETGFGKENKRPKDYLEEFRSYVLDHQDKIEALKLCATRPRELTRKTLRDLQLELDKHGYSETRLRVAWRETKNEEIAATIIGYVRNAVLDTPLKPFEERVSDAMKAILASQAWTKPQRSWLQRIGKQFKENTLVDRQSLDEGVFKEKGGFDRLNKVFDGKLADLLGQITEHIWGVAA